MNYNCGGILVDLIIPEKDRWVNQQSCIDIIVETGNPDLAYDVIAFGESLIHAGITVMDIETGFSRNSPEKHNKLMGND